MMSLYAMMMLGIKANDVAHDYPTFDGDASQIDQAKQMMLVADQNILPYGKQMGKYECFLDYDDEIVDETQL